MIYVYLLTTMSKLSANFHLYNHFLIHSVESLVSSPTTTVTTGDPSANLSCEVYGYIMTQPPTITWNFGSDVLMSDSVFTITVQDGNNMIQNGGDTPQPSIRSVLTINHPNKTHEGSYICSLGGGSRTTILQVMEGRLQ